MARDELSLLLGGPQGAGLETSATLLTTTFAYLGYGGMSDREYFSNIKGRHSYIHSRISSGGIPCALTYPVQAIGAMDAETVFTHYNDLEEGGYLIYDAATSDKQLSSIPSTEAELMERVRKEFSEWDIDGTVSSLTRHLSESRRVRIVELNYSAILTELARKFTLRGSQASRYVSSIIVGAIAGIVNLDEAAARYALERRFSGTQAIVEQNSFLISYVLDQVKSKHGSPLQLNPSQLGRDELMVASGNDVIAMAKVAGGLRYQSYYPITPAADESFLIEATERLEVDGQNYGSVVVVQTEDEIAAVNSAIGAALAGARSATATSGPGFSLMVEGLSWAGMNEVPLVITYYQRGGPSTGHPTRGSQSDLLFSLFAGHGEFPRIVLASGDHLESFYDTVEAFNLAEKYQMPVIHLVDKFLANTIMTMPVPDLSAMRIERGLIKYDAKEYKRFNLSETISPRAFVGSDVVLWHAGDEHNETGHIDEDPAIRVKMYDKRMRKLEIADLEIPPERRAVYFGPEDAEFLVIGWGYVKGVATDALRELERRGLKGSYLHLKMFAPFPSKYVRSIIEKFDREKVMAAEHNYLAQAGKIITMNTGITVERAITKYTGRPMYTNELVKGIERILGGERRVMMTYGE